MRSWSGAHQLSHHCQIICSAGGGELILLHGVSAIGLLKTSDIHCYLHSYKVLQALAPLHEVSCLLLLHYRHPHILAAHGDAHGILPCIL